MNYQQTLDYLFARLPMYQRIGPAAYKANLDNTLRIAELLGKPHQKLNCIHVAGTNGKGSSSHMLAAALQQCGYKTGLYTSPHLIDFRERIRINGKMIPQKKIIEFVGKYKQAFEAIEPSFFEWTVGLAFDYFAAEEVDVAVIEVGLGGRLDSTNIITPKVSLITNIGFDHMNLLGDTLDKIGREKAGIIKPRVPVVVSQYQSETGPMFSAVARELKAPLEFADKNYKVLQQQVKDGLLEVTLLNKKTGNNEVWELDLTGSYQSRNLLGVLEVLDVLGNSGFLLEQDRVRSGLKQVVKLTGLMGRWQQLGQKPTIIADTGHNEDGIGQVLENLKIQKYSQLHVVFGVVNDKEIGKLLRLLPKNAIYYFVKANIPRALDAAELQKQAAVFKLNGKAFDSVGKGLAAAKKAAKKSDLIFIGGSTFVVGDALTEMSGED